MKFGEFSINEGVSNNSFVFTFQDKTVSKKSGNNIELDNINKKYEDKFINQMGTLGYKVTKDNTIEKVRTVEFDKEINKDSKTTELFDKISKERDNEIKNL